jgi:hypothetical protein
MDASFFPNMCGIEADIVEAPKEPTDTGSDAMLLEEAENSSSSKLSKEVDIFLCACSHMTILKFYFDKCCTCRSWAI